MKQFVRLALGLLLAVAAETLNAAPVGNDDVLSLISAGLTDPTILQVIDSANPAKFDISPTGIVKLKKAGASEAVIQRILSKQTGAQTATSPLSTSSLGQTVNVAKGGDCKPEITGMGERVVLRAGGKIIPLSFKKAQIDTNIDGASIIGNLLSMGLIKAKGGSSLRLDGKRAAVRIQDRMPEFLDIGAMLGTSPDDVLPFFRLTTNDNSRSLEISTTEVGLGASTRERQYDDKVRIPLSFELVADQCNFKGQIISLYRLKPKAPLESGEYAVITGTIGWDFGVD
jgi:hypothetical protein